MKRIVVLVAIFIATITLSACETTIDVPEEINYNRNALSILSYISTSFLGESNTLDSNADTNVIRLGIDQPVKDDKDDKDATLSDTEISVELEQVNVYIDKLKSFIENGVENFGSIVEEDSDRAEYEYMIRIYVQEEESVLYYNLQIDTDEISGIFIVDDNEYAIDVENSDFSSEASDDEEKQSMLLRARQGDNVIIVEYEIKQENDESKQTFTCNTSINGTVEQFEVIIKNEEDEYVLMIIENGNEYTFKMDNDDEEDDFNYKLDYIVNDVKGKVRIKVTTDEFGEESYYYRIQEKNIKIDIEMEDPDNQDDEGM